MLLTPLYTKKQNVSHPLFFYLQLRKFHLQTYFGMTDSPQK